VTALLAVEELDVRHGLLQAVRQVSLELAEGEPDAVMKDAAVIDAYLGSAEVTA
jgi:ABC-type branched-subunit amino acid transport system ATPase component